MTDALEMYVLMRLRRCLCDFAPSSSSPGRVPHVVSAHSFAPVTSQVCCVGCHVALCKDAASALVRKYSPVEGINVLEELTGISGMYLERQIRYVELVVEYVWQLYSPRAEGIIFVAHSMGGVVVRSLLRDPRFDTSRIAFIITLATPHTSPRNFFAFVL